jgi:Rap1a immunity proteins
MRFLAYLIIAIWFGVFAQGASAQLNSTTQELITDCRNAVRIGNGATISPLATMGAGFCDGYLSGHMQVPRTLTFCTPPGTTRGQLIAMFHRWADQHPERWHLTPYDALTDAFQEAWPCKS